MSSVGNYWDIDAILTDESVSTFSVSPYAACAAVCLRFDAPRAPERSVGAPPVRLCFWCVDALL